MLRSQLISAAALCLLASTLTAQEGQTSAERAKQRHLAGHSRFGEAFDEGPRERPTRMTGIGMTHFPITTSNPEAQQWLDQGHTLIHSFWFYEAGRVHWAHHGGAPFSDFTFLVSQLQRMNQRHAAARATVTVAQ